MLLSDAARAHACGHGRRYHLGRWLRACVVVVLLAAVAGAGAIVAPVATPRAAADVTITLDGHGYGHGIGLSQWGAYGYAVEDEFSWPYTEILDHYYGGTIAGTVPVDTVITVRLQALDNAQTAVVSATGRLVVDGVPGGPWKSVVARETATGYSVWGNADAEVCPSTGSLSGNWSAPTAVNTSVTIRTQANSSTATDYSALASVCAPNGSLRAYRGVIRAINDANGLARTVNEVPVEQYLRSVIAKEMSPSWGAAGDGKGMEALKAQAVAARSYGLAENRYTYAKTCDSTSCQAYYGAATRTSVGSGFSQVEYPLTDQAVLDTAGIVRRVATDPWPIAYTMFSASSGGWTAPGTSSLAPFPAVIDGGDDTAPNPNHDWSATLTGNAIAAKYPTIGSFTSLEVLARNGYGDWGGRVTSLRVAGTSGSVTVTGDAFRSAMGLKSNWFNVRGSAPLDRCADLVPPAAAPVAAGGLVSPADPDGLLPALRCIWPVAG
ncbi:MAG: SpoIID/LytB domain-containing protein [Actinomycetota bacterium]|nr:SpoIID/LytB domain-containing protein [Actinomycetota bacterium]